MVSVNWNASHSVDTDRIDAMLKANKPVHVKFGIDPTGTTVHLGHMVVLRKLQQLQDLGCKISLVIGDLTAQIGDPSGRDTSRPVLSKQETESNAHIILSSIQKFIDTDKCDVVFNSTISNDVQTLIPLLNDVSVQHLLARDHFKNRFQNNSSISILEMLCPILQAHDSVVLNPDLEIGGNDQMANCHLARNLMQKRGMVGQAILLMPILVGTDGVKKMSKTLGNHIGFDDSPTDKFGKTMSIPDNIMQMWFDLLTDKGINPNLSPMENKIILAKEVVKTFHGTSIADFCEKEFDNRIRKGIIPDNPIVVFVKTPSTLVQTLVETKLATSKSDARRKIESGSVKINTQKTTNENVVVNNKDILQVGKRIVVKVVVCP